VVAVEKVLSVAGTSLRAILLPDRESYQSRLSCAQLGVSAPSFLRLRALPLLMGSVLYEVA